MSGPEGVPPPPPPASDDGGASAAAEGSLLYGIVNEIISSPLNLALVGVISFLLYKITRSRQQPVALPPPPPELPRLRRDFTLAELKPYDGTQPDGRVLVALNGTVYDVTKGKNFYGPGGPYAVFGGRDASRGLGTFSVSASPSDEYDDLSDLKSHEMDSMREWEMQFKERYIHVGRLLKPGEQPTNYSDEDEDTPTEGGSGGSSGAKKRSAVVAAAAAAAAARGPAGDGPAAADKKAPADSSSSSNSSTGPSTPAAAAEGGGAGGADAKGDDGKHKAECRSLRADQPDTLIDDLLASRMEVAGPQQQQLNHLHQLSYSSHHHPEASDRTVVPAANTSTIFQQQHHQQQEQEQEQTQRGGGSPSPEPTTDGLEGDRLPGVPPPVRRRSRGATNRQQHHHHHHHHHRSGQQHQPQRSHRSVHQQQQRPLQEGDSSPAAGISNTRNTGSSSSSSSSSTSSHSTGVNDCCGVDSDGTVSSGSDETGTQHRPGRSYGGSSMGLGERLRHDQHSICDMFGF